jgi:hypothetical protein
LAPVAEQTFSPVLAVNRSGAAVAAWFSGTGPIVTAGLRGESAGEAPPTSPNWNGNGIVVDLGSVSGGFQEPVTIAHDGNDVQGYVKVALSSSRVAFVAWATAGHSGWMIATARNGRFGRPRRLGIPHNAQLARLASGLDGPVDAFWYRNRADSTGAAYGWSCSRLNADGSLGNTTPVKHPFKANPCSLSLTQAMAVRLPLDPIQPPGYQMATYSLVSRTDGHGDSIAIWDDWPTGSGYTYGMFAAIRRR